MARMKTATTAPTRKVLATATGGGVGQAFSDVLVYFLEAALNHPLPDHVAFSLSILVSALCAVAAGYLTPPAPDEQVVPR
jgi:NADH:ubiquinone oxidoreductase subunit H